MKKIALYSASVLATITVLLLLWQFREAVILFLFSLGVAAAVRPLAEMLIQKGVSRSLSILIVYLVFLGTLIALLVAISSLFFNDLQRLSNVFTTTYETIWSTWPKGTQLQQTIVAQLPPPQTLFTDIAGGQGAALFQSLFGFTLATFTLGSQVLAILILSIYWSIDRIHFERLWLSLLPVEGRARAREIWRDIETGVSAYIRSEIVQSILTGIILGFAFSLLGIDFPILLAIFAALAWLVPWIGALIALLPVAIVGFSMSPTMGTIASLITVCVLLVMEIGVEPRLFNRKRYNPLLIVLFIVAFADLFGLVGVIVAPPLAAAVQILFRQLVAPAVTAAPAATPNESVRKIADLGERIDQIQSLVDQMDETPSPQSLNMLERLEKLVGKARELTDDYQESNQPTR